MTDLLTSILPDISMNSTSLTDSTTQQFFTSCYRLKTFILESESVGFATQLVWKLPVHFPCTPLSVQYNSSIEDLEIRANIGYNGVQNRTFASFKFYSGLFSTPHAALSIINAISAKK